MMKRIMIGIVLILCLMLIPQVGMTGSFWSFGISGGSCNYGGCNSGYYGYGGSCYAPVAPVVPVVPYGGCATSYYYNSSCCYGPVYHYHYNYRNWYDHPYYGPSYRHRRYYYGGAYHPGPPAYHYHNGHHHSKTRINIGNCNNCNIYGTRYRRRPR